MVNLREALELWLQVTLKTDGKAQTESQRAHQILENRAIHLAWGGTQEWVQVMGGGIECLSLYFLLNHLTLPREEKQFTKHTCYLAGFSRPSLDQWWGARQKRDVLVLTLLLTVMETAEQVLLPPHLHFPQSTPQKQLDTSKSVIPK